ncbi:hypothetical protein C8R45DRAFT_1211783 [Mycena sanguinolenta]|nr:hypothetical protein C8R45DRAFT_1211783 [Mycena sanguinolenta]
MSTDRIRDLLRSGSPPPPNLSSIVSVLAAGVRQNDNDKAKLKDELSRLESRRSALEPYYLDCRSLLAPIHRLPSEILTDIFQLCRLSKPQVSASNREPLLLVSQVCILWHTLVMGTPSLWDTISLHASAFWGTPQQTETTMGLLRLAFERNGSSPLNVEFGSFEGHATRYGPALELIAIPHDGNLPNSYLSGVQGNLPLLRTLQLSLDGVALEKVDFLRSAPDVKNLTVRGSIEFCAPRLPLEGLVAYDCIGLEAKAIAWAMASMSRLSHPCAVRVEASLYYWDKVSYSRAGGLRLPQTSSNISSLSLEVTRLGREVIARCLQTFEEIFAALTLPSLCDLSFRADYIETVTLPWPHTQFMAFSIRSTCHSHLRSLNLFHVTITEPELVDCLSTLPALQQLSIADHVHFHKTLVTTTLLTALTRTPEDSACPIPVYLAYLVSRCESRPSNQIPFVNRMRCSSESTLYRRPVDANVAARIQYLCAQGALTFE